MLFSIHKGMVVLTKCPEFDLDNDDAKKLGEAIAGVMAFHKVKMTPKQEAYALLMEAAAEVYPPMVVTLYIRKKMEAEAAKKNQPPKPVVMTPQPQQAPSKPPATITPIRSPVAAGSGGAGFDPLNIKLDP